MSNPNVLPSDKESSPGHQELWERLGGMFGDLGNLATAEIIVSPAGVMRCSFERTVDEPRLSAHGRIIRITQVVEGSGPDKSHYQLSVQGDESLLPDISFYYKSDLGRAVTWEGQEVPIVPGHYEVIRNLLESSLPGRHSMLK